jgi:hypothetical protein
MACLLVKHLLVLHTNVRMRMREFDYDQDHSTYSDIPKLNNHRIQNNKN